MAACGVGAAVLAQPAPRQGVALNGSLGLNLGSGNPGLVTAVDTLTVNGTTYDFGPRAYTAHDCKQGGWATNFADGKFVNQGDCVSFHASAGTTHPKG